VVICLERGRDDLHIVQLMSLPPRHLLLHYNWDWFNLSGTSLPRLSWRKAVRQIMSSVSEQKLFS